MVIFYVCSVWGDFHINTFKSITLPSLCASGNLPEVAKTNDVKFEIFTTKQDRGRVLALPIIQHLATFVDLQITAASDESHPSSHFHIEWWLACVEKVQQAGGILQVIHPDYIWSERALSRVVEIMQEGKAGIVFPWIRAVSETFLPAIALKAGEDPAATIEIAPRELLKLTHQHLHPNYICMMNGSSTGGYPMSLCWSVPKEGIIHRWIQQEVLVINPKMCRPNFKFKALSDGPLDDFYLIEDSDELCCVEVAPLTTDFSLYSLGVPRTALELVKNSLAPENDVPLNERLIRSHVRYIYEEPTESLWESAKIEADQVMSSALTLRRMMAVRNCLKDQGRVRAAQLLAMVTQTGGLVAPTGDEDQYALFIPDEEALNIHLSDPVFIGMLKKDARLALQEYFNERVLARHIKRGQEAVSIEMMSGRQIEATVNEEIMELENGVTVIDQFDAGVVSVYLTSDFL